MNFQLMLPIAVVVFAQSAFASFIPRKITAGASSTCALSVDGRVKCWGKNNVKQLGTETTIRHGGYENTMGEALPTINLGTGVKASDICSGANYSCIIAGGGGTKCWGINDGGSLSFGGDQSYVPRQVKMGDQLPFLNLGTNFHAKSIACGAFHACALNTEGKAKCWGNNFAGALGVGDNKDRGAVPSDMGDNLPFIPTEKKILAISAGQYQTCAVLEDGLRCWGSNSDGQLGQEISGNLGDTQNSSGDKIKTINLEPPGETISIKKVSLSFNYFACAVYTVHSTEKNNLKCWGNNADGGLGIGSTLPFGKNPGSMGSGLPSLNLNIDEIVNIETYSTSSCVLSKTGRVKCWGRNFEGALGAGNNTYYGRYPEVSGGAIPDVDIGGLPVRALSSGIAAHHTCAILANNMVKCWGRGNDGSLGYEKLETIGNGASDMGENLPFVNLGN